MRRLLFAVLIVAVVLLLCCRVSAMDEPEEEEEQNDERVQALVRLFEIIASIGGESTPKDKDDGLPIQLPSAEEARKQARSTVVRTIQRGILDAISAGQHESMVMGSNGWVMPLNTNELPSDYQQIDLKFGWWKISWKQETGNSS